MRARVLVLLALAAALLCALLSFGEMDRLPQEERSGQLTAVIKEVKDDRLVLTEAELDGEEIDGNILFYSQPCGCEMQPGMRVEMEVVLEPLKSSVNPHGWDDRTWYIYKGAVYTCDGEISAHSAYAPTTLRGVVRGAMLKHTAELWTGEEGSVIGALLLGDEGGMTEETQEAFRRSGAAHLLAVSGLHVGFVAMLVLLMFGWMRRNSVGQLIVVFVCMGLYSLAAESAFSVFRAMLMLAMGLIAGHVGRKADGLTSLAAAVLIALILDPMEILRAGFLLSVSAVLGILMLGGRLDQLMERVVRIKWLRSSVAVSLAAQLGAMPVQLAMFGTVNVLSLLTNLIAVPLAAGIVMLGLPTVLLHMLLPAAAAFPGAAVDLMARLLTMMCEAVAGINFAQISVEAPPIFVLVCMMGLLYLCSPYFMEHGKRGRIVCAAVVLSAAAVSLALWLPGEMRESKDKAVFLSVGTADCAVLQSEKGCVMIDTGWSGSQAVRYVQGENRKLNAVILTHADSDHAGGLENVLRSVEVGAVFVPKSMSLEGMEDALAAAKECGVPIMELCAGDCMDVGAYEMEVLSPEHVREGKENEDSLVLKVTHGNTVLLMTGDVTAAAEERLTLPDCDILKIPHHGSATGTSDALLDKARPEDAVISVGTPNRYDFPREDVLIRLNERNVSVWRTDEDNAVVVTFDEEGYEIEGYEPMTIAQEWFFGR